MLALLRYGNGMPFYRLEGLQAACTSRCPMPRSGTSCSKAVPAPRAVFEELIRQAAQAQLLHNDDTPARILSLMRERTKAEAAGNTPVAKAINTSGIVAELQGRKVVLFFTGHAHAGQEPGNGAGASGPGARSRRCRCATRWRPTSPASSPPCWAIASRTADARLPMSSSSSPTPAAT